MRSKEPRARRAASNSKVAGSPVRPRDQERRADLSPAAANPPASLVRAGSPARGVRARSAAEACKGRGRNQATPAKDESQPSPRAQEPEDQSGGTVAPEGQSQTDMVLRTIKDLLAKDAVTPELEKETGMTRAQMEQFVKKYEKAKSAPAGPGREIQVKPGDRDEADKPAANLPGIDPKTGLPPRIVTDRGQMGRDDVRNNIEGIRFTAPPEFRSKVEGYKSTLSRSRTGAAAPRRLVPRPPEASNQRRAEIGKP